MLSPESIARDRSRASPESEAHAAALTWTRHQHQRQRSNVPADATEEGATDDVVLGGASVPTRFSFGGDVAAASAMPRRRAASKVTRPSAAAAATPGPGSGAAATSLSTAGGLRAVGAAESLSTAGGHGPWAPRQRGPLRLTSRQRGGRRR